MASHKIAKKNGTADEIELSVAQALFDLENNANDLKAELTPLQISSAKEVSLTRSDISLYEANYQKTGHRTGDQHHFSRDISLYSYHPLGALCACSFLCGLDKCYF
jgi:hypothetical protein